MNENIKIAKQLVKLAKCLVAKNDSIPAKGDYHNNPTNIDAHIGRKEQKKINHSCRLQAQRDGIADKIFDYVLINLKTLFADAVPETDDIMTGIKINDAYDKRYYNNTCIIHDQSGKSKIYSVRFMVKIPTQDVTRKKDNTQKNKLYSIEVHK